jgi:hypothetical protein
MTQLDNRSSGATPEATKPLAVTVKAACEIIGVGRTTMFGLIKSGRVNTARIGRRRVVVFASLVALLDDAGDAS